MLADSLFVLGHDTRVAFDGPQAVEAAAAFRPHVALFDLGLPVMDGFELAQRLKALPGRESLELVAITGYGQDIDRHRTSQAGFDEHMVKPVDLDGLRCGSAAASCGGMLACKGSCERPNPHVPVWEIVTA